MKPARLLFALFVFFPFRLLAQPVESGTIAGSVFDAATNRPAELVGVTLKKNPTGELAGNAVTDSHGAFSFANIPFGEYQVVYGAAGLETRESASFVIDAQHRTIDLGPLTVTLSTAIKLAAVQVSARQEAFENSIDRKVYNVGKDLLSASGSASDLLQNVPSVQVDIDGNVSLRGNDNVLILIDGKPSTLMNPANRAMALEQMSADSIEKIEVITNPSAKYKPDGTAGIINITLKRSHAPGYSATVRVNVGNDSRYSFGFTANYNPGKYNVYTALNVRQDDRSRFTQENRTHLDPVTNLPVSTAQSTVERSRPLSRVAQVGADYRVDDATKVAKDDALQFDNAP